MKEKDCRASWGACERVCGKFRRLPATRKLHRLQHLAGERAGLALLSACRNGTCRACICRLSSGQVMYRIEWPGLSAEEKQEGYILPCVAYPLSDVVMR